MDDPKPPLCPSHGGFKHQPGCPHCRALNAWRMRDLRRRRKAGETVTVPAGPVVQRIAQLMGAGMRLSDITDRSGVWVPAVWENRHRRKRVTAVVADAILGVPFPRRRPGPVRNRRLVDATGTRRRVHALAAIGWPAHEVAERAGVSVRAVHDVSGSVRRWVSPELATAVREVYESLQLRLGPSTRVVGKARAKGYPPPLAWDDDIDDPEARPRGAVVPRRAPALDELVVVRLMRGERVAARPVERREAMRRLVGEGLTHAEVGERLRLTRSAVSTALRRQRKRGVAA